MPRALGCVWRREELGYRHELANFLPRVDECVSVLDGARGHQQGLDHNRFIQNEADGDGRQGRHTWTQQGFM